MDDTLSYADILKKILQEATRVQPRLQAIKLYPDSYASHYLSKDRSPWYCQEKAQT